MGPITGVILAGGRGTRMHNANKPLLKLAGRPLVAHVIALAQPQVENLVISVNSDLIDYRRFHLPLVPDLSAQREGPLVGIFSAMKWYRERGQETGFLACFPADVPVFPRDLVATLLAALQTPPDSGEEACPHDTVIWCKTGNQIQPLFSLWPFASLPRLRQAISAGIHGPRLLFQSCPNRLVQLSTQDKLQFLNINTPEELTEAERLMTQHR